MLVRDLIEELKKHPPHISVILSHGNYGNGSDIEKVHGVTYPKKYKDGAYYDENVSVVEIVISEYSPLCY